jgi:hypothetical protein
MLIQAYIPNRVANQSGGTIQLLMESLKIKSGWILISKKILANKKNMNTPINMAN